MSEELTTSILHLVIVIAGSFLLYSPKLNLSNLSLADMPSGCVYNKRKKKTTKKLLFLLFLTGLVCFNEMVGSWIILRLGHPSIFWEEWPFDKKSVEKVENIQTHARLKQSYSMFRKLTVINRGTGEPTDYEDQLKQKLQMEDNCFPRTSLVKAFWKLPVGAQTCAFV